MYIPTQEDKEILYQQGIEERIRIELLNDKFQTIDTLEQSLISDSYTVDADSDMRRTYEGTFFVKDSSFFIGENKKIWTDKYIKVWKGIKNLQTNLFVWYNLGIFLFNDTSYTYNETTNQVVISCVDLMSKLNNTFSGQIPGAFDFLIPCEQTVAETYEKVGRVQATSNDGINVSNIIVSIGTAFELSLISPTPRYKYNELQNIELVFFDVKIYDKDNNVLPNETQMRISVDDEVKAKDISDEIVFSLGKEYLKKPIFLGFLQNASFKQLTIRYHYKEIETANDFEVHYLDDFYQNVHWRFYDSKFYKSCIGFNEIITNERTKTLLNEDNKNTLTINTTKRTVNDTITKPTDWYKTVIDTIKDTAKIQDYMVSYTDTTVPYDLEFSTGTTSYDILKKLVELNSSWEMFFDVNGSLIIQPTPMLYEDDVILTADEMYPLVISEASKDSFSNVRNISEIWGMNIDSSYHSENCTTTNSGYNVVFDDLLFTDEKRISNNTILSVKISSDNIENPQFIITGKYNDLGTQTSEKVTLEPLYLYTSNGEILEAGTLKKDICYCIKYYKSKLYLMGQFRVHGMCIETNKSPTDEEKEQNKTKYNCENIYYSVEPESPYCIEKIGERLQVLNGDDYENIYSDELAVERAKWENWKKTRRQETITIETLDIPWLDVNCKIEYKSFIDGEIHQYIVKNINSSASNGTMTIELMRFYPLYILDAKQYEAVVKLQKYKDYLISQYSYSVSNVELLQTYVDNGATEIYLTDSVDSIQPILVSYKNKLDNVAKE